MAVEKIPGFDKLSSKDRVELIKFEHYLRRRSDGEKANESNFQLNAYAEVYGEVVFEDKDYKKK